MSATNNPKQVKRFCNNFRNAFTVSGLESVAELARESGVDYNTIIIAMRGKGYINIISLTKVCKALKVSLDKIMEGVVED
jgi:transcriptional regulator with XRE-family HTH domain